MIPDGHSMVQRGDGREVWSDFCLSRSSGLPGKASEWALIYREVFMYSELLHHGDGAREGATPVSGPCLGSQMS